MTRIYPHGDDAPLAEERSDLDRRTFLKQLAASSVAAAAMGRPRTWADESAEQVEHPEPTADSRCILLWMAGGMAAPEMFDPKQYHPLREWETPVREDHQYVSRLSIRPWTTSRSAKGLENASPA